MASTDGSKDAGNDLAGGGAGEPSAPEVTFGLDPETLFYIGHMNSPCAYLSDREARLRFLDGTLLAAAYRTLLDRGYRRHGEHVYRTDCSACRECQVLRVPVDRFAPTRSQRRVLTRGDARLRTELGAPEYSGERAELYGRYLAFQHGREEDPDELSYRQFFVSTLPELDTRELRQYDGDRLVGLGIVDLVEDALSSVYYFFDPDYAAFSPGTYSMLYEVRLASDLGLRWYYPGFYIAECPAMNYKARIRPAELLRPPEGVFRPLPAAGKTSTHP